mmetsp:Transcript_63214/g.75984  ORF Transcript_63214/g.75984 Transcript_63214/m.75984 type:complete len:179 (+) Transcript_63214:49-585(+)
MNINLDRLLQNNRQNQNAILPSNRSIVLISLCSLIVIGCTKVTEELRERRGGIYGILRLLWEGDHLPQEIRKSLNTLKKIEQTDIQKMKQSMDEIELGIEIAILNSVDCNLSFEKVNVSSTMRKKMGIASSELDKIASTLDSVHVNENSSLRAKRKMLSKEIVIMMEHMDVLIEKVIT